MGWPSPCREGRCLDRSGGSCIVGGRAAGVEHRFARRRFPGVAGPRRQRRRCPRLGRRHGGCAVCGTRFRDHHLGDPERPVVLPSLGAQQLWSDRWRGRCRHGRRGGVGCDRRLEVGRRRSDRHRHRLQPSGSRGQHLAKSGRDRGRRDRQRPQRLRRRRPRLGLCQQRRRSVRRRRARHPRGRHDRCRGQQRRGNRRRVVERVADGPEVSRGRRQRLDQRRRRRDQLRHADAAVVRRERGGHEQQLGWGRIFVGPPRRDRRRRLGGRAVRCRGGQRVGEQRRHALVPGKLRQRRRDLGRRDRFVEPAGDVFQLRGDHGRRGRAGRRHLLDRSGQRLCLLQWHLDGDPARDGHRGAACGGESAGDGGAAPHRDPLHRRATARPRGQGGDGWTGQCRGGPRRGRRWRR